MLTSVSRNIALVVVSFLILVSPLFVSAQTIPTIPSNPTIEQLQALIIQLTQILQQLLAARAGHSDPTPSPGTGASLRISVSASPAAQTVVAGGTVIAANIILDTTASSEDLRLVQLDPVYSDSMPVDPIFCQAFLNDTALNTGARVVNPNNNGYTGAESYSMVFDNPLVLARGTVKTISIRCTIPALATTGSFSWGASSNSNTCAKGVTSGNDVCPVVNTNYGNTMSLVAGGSGSLSIATDSSAPSYQLVAGGTSGVTVTVLKLRASGENINLQKVGISLEGAAAYSGDLAGLVLYDGSTAVGTVTFTGANNSAVAVLSSPITIPRDTDKLITVKANIANIGVGQTGRAGDLIRIFPNPDTAGVGQSSGANVSASGNTTPPAGTRMFRSYPTVAKVSLPSEGLADGRLLRFSVTANSAGQISVSQLGFAISGNASQLQSIALYAYSDASFSVPVAGTGSGALGTAVVANPFVPKIAFQPIVIPAGATRYFEVRGVGNLGGTSIITLPPNLEYRTLGVGTMTEETFLWSPNTRTTPLISEADWTNGYGVSALGITQIRNGNGTNTCPSGTTGTYPNCTSTATTTPMISCSIHSNKSSFTLGETITFSWTSTNATYGYFVPDTSGKDNLQVPGDKLTASGTQQIPASVIGSPFVTLRVANAAGQTADCTSTVTVTSAVVAIAKTIVLSSGSSWQVPMDWNQSNNKIEVIGGGGGGGDDDQLGYGGYGGGGGGGGGYAKATNVTLTRGGTIYYRVGVGGTGGTGTGNGTAGGATYVCTSSSDCGSGAVVGAQGGGNGYWGSNAGGVAGRGGAPFAGTGYVGGDGYRGYGSGAAGGGGGAAGPNGAGSGGSGNGGSSNANTGAPGGVYPPCGVTGGSGGTSSLNSAATAAGGGGSAGNGSSGGAGGSYGGGGGGAGVQGAGCATYTAGGAGGNGVVIITYTPVATVSANANNVSNIAFAADVEGHVAGVSTTADAQLASVLTALESILQDIIANYSH